MATEKQQQSDKTIVEFVPFGADSKVKLSIEIVKRLICVKTKSGKICSDEDAIKFMAMCQARKLNPFEGDAFLIGYDGREGPTFSLITAHQAFLKRAEVNAEYDGMESGVVVEQNGVIADIQGDFTSGGQKVVGGWARVFFKHREHPMYKRIRLSRFQKSYGIWQDDPAGMICKCAEADALRSSFPTMLGGLYLREENGPPTIEILEPKIPTHTKDMIVEAAVGGDHKTEPPQETPEQAAMPGKPEPKPRAPKKKPQLEVKPEPAAPLISKIGPNRKELAERIALGSYTESDFLLVANHNEWLGKGRAWTSMDEVPDDMLEVFLQPEEWGVVMEQLDALPRHTKD